MQLLQAIHILTWHEHVVDERRVLALGSSVLRIALLLVKRAIKCLRIHCTRMLGSMSDAGVDELMWVLRCCGRVTSVRQARRPQQAVHWP
jgi:hypothetical protein